MGRPRKFDWDEAARLYAACGSYSEVARRLGVTPQSVRTALNPHLREYQSLWQKERRAWIGVCPDCGGPAANAQRSRHGGRCLACYLNAVTVSVRPDTLRCAYCRLWLPDDAFPRKAAAKARRHRHHTCTACARVEKRDWREINREHVRAYDRERKRLERERAKALA